MTPKINWKPSDPELKKFGWTILVGFGVIGGLFFWRGKPNVAWAMWEGSTFVWALSMAAPSLARPFYMAWMGFGFVMGSIMSRVIMGVIFFFIITPVALFFKVIGRDTLHRNKRSTDSYWCDHPKISDPKYYEHLS